MLIPVFYLFGMSLSCHTKNIPFSSHPFSSQCTQEILQEYYINLVHTHSSGGPTRFTIRGASEQPSIASDSDDMDTGGTGSPVASASPAPVFGRSGTPRGRENESESEGEGEGFGERGRRRSLPARPRPTIEQNVAFAELQQSLERRERTDQR